MRFGYDMITFEEAVAYLKDMPRFTVKKILRTAGTLNGF